MLFCNKLPLMAQYKISGIWKGADNIITHYAFHTVTANQHTRATKTSKSKAIELLETEGNSAITWLWNYKQASWENGEVVEVVKGINGKYLRSNRDNKLSDNLAHLIDFDWIQP
jgi:Protein of unknown function (DUF3892)